MTELSYTLAIQKCSQDCSRVIKYLGLLVDSHSKSVLVPKDKKESFARLREGIIGSDEVEAKSFRKFAGKAVSFSLI